MGSSDRRSLKSCLKRDSCAANRERWTSTARRKHRTLAASRASLGPPLEAATRASGRAGVDCVHTRAHRDGADQRIACQVLVLPLSSHIVRPRCPSSIGVLGSCKAARGRLSSRRPSHTREASTMRASRCAALHGEQDSRNGQNRGAQRASGRRRGGFLFPPVCAPLWLAAPAPQRSAELLHRAPFARRWASPRPCPPACQRSRAPRMATTRRAGSRLVMGFLARVHPPSHAFLCRCPPARPPAPAHVPCVVGRRALTTSEIGQSHRGGVEPLSSSPPGPPGRSIDLPRYTLEWPPIESRRSLLHCDCLSTTLLFSYAAPLRSPFTLGPGLLFCFFRFYFRLPSVVLSCTASPPIPSFPKPALPAVVRAASHLPQSTDPDHNPPRLPGPMHGVRTTL